MAGTEDERESAPPAVNAEKEQPDTPSLPDAADALDYSLQTTTHQIPTLMQHSLLAQPTFHLQSNETSPLKWASPIASHHPSHHPMYITKTVVKINGNLSEMATGWTEEEWTNRRRIVQFEKSQIGKRLDVDFKAISVNEITANSIYVSCIWRDNRSDCYFTQIDAMDLVEQLMEATGRFSVTEKNRLRRRFEGFHPETISKTNEHHSGFFETVMTFGHPKPRKMEKDFKVFPWSCLEQMLKTIIAKHSVMSSETNNRLPRRKRKLISNNTPVASSKMPKIRFDRPGTYLP